MPTIDQNPPLLPRKMGDGISQSQAGGDTAVLEALPKTTSQTSSMMMSSSSSSAPWRQIASLWKSQSDFYKSLDNFFFEKFRSKDSTSIQQRAILTGDREQRDDGCVDVDMESSSLRECLLSRSLLAYLDSSMSQKWISHYKHNHEEINPKTVFIATHSHLLQEHDDDVQEHEAIADPPQPSQNSTQTTTTTTTTDWGAMFRQGLPSYQRAAEMVQVQQMPTSTKSVQAEPSTSERDAPVRPALRLLPPLPLPSIVDAPSSSQLHDSDASSDNRSNGTADDGAKNTFQHRDGSTVAATNNNNNNSKRKRPSVRSRKHDPIVKTFYPITDADVLCGRGGRTNHHPGNKVYLSLKNDIQERYLTASDKDKTAISQELVYQIQKRGGRFLERDNATGNWFEITFEKAWKKASQTLRERNTPDVRKAKRERYGK